MKTNDIRVIKLMKEGLSFETLRNLNESQINVLYKRIVKEGDGTVTTSDTKKAEEMAKAGLNVRLEKEIDEDDQLDQDIQNNEYGDTDQDEKQQGPGEYGNNPNNDKKMDNNDVDGMSIESEIKEKAVSKKQQKFMGVVKAMQDGDLPIEGEAGKVAQEMKPSDVVDFASTKHKGLPNKVEKTKKESYLRNVKMIEESLIKLVQKHITPTMTKKDLINLVEQNPGTKTAPPKTKPGTKKPPIYKPKHTPAPKAKKDDETFAMQLPSPLTFDNLNIKFSDEKES